MQDRWTEDTAKWVRNVPWHRYKDQHDADGDIPEEKVVESREPELEKLEPKMVIKTRQPPPRAFQIRKEDAEKARVHEGLREVLELVQRFGTATAFGCVQSQVCGVSEG